MKIKVPVKYLDGKALIAAIDTQIISMVDAALPVTGEWQRGKDRDAMYRQLKAQEEALVHLLKDRSWAILDLQCGEGHPARAQLIRFSK